MMSPIDLAWPVVFTALLAAGWVILLVLNPGKGEVNVSFEEEINNVHHLRELVRTLRGTIANFEAAGVVPRPSEIEQSRRVRDFVRRLSETIQKDVDLSRFAFDKAAVDPKVLSGSLDLVERAREIHGILKEPTEALEALRKEVADMLRISGDLDQAPTNNDNP